MNKCSQLSCIAVGIVLSASTFAAGPEESSNDQPRMALAQSLILAKPDIRGYRWDDTDHNRTTLRDRSFNQAPRLGYSSSTSHQYETVAGIHPNAAPTIVRSGMITSDSSVRNNARGSSDIAAFTDAESTPFKWSVRSSSEQNTYKWGLRSSAEHNTYKWGLRSSADQNTYKWGLR